MLVINNENIEPFDCDDTLVMHVEPDQIPPGESVRVYDAVTKKFITMRINRPMVRLLREAKARGFFVLVWSRGGKRWAADIVKALDLVDFVDIVMTKPLHYFDDKDVAKWLTERVYIEPNVVYKHLTTKEK